MEDPEKGGGNIGREEEGEGEDTKEDIGMTERSEFTEPDVMMTTGR